MIMSYLVCSAYCLVTCYFSVAFLLYMLFFIFWPVLYVLLANSNVEQLFLEQNKSTGELSFLTCLMNSGGSLGKSILLMQLLDCQGGQEVLSLDSDFLC